MDLQMDEIKTLPIWVQFPSLDLKYWGMECLSKIGSLLGVPLKTDKYTKERTSIRFARLLIEMPLEGPFPDYVEFANEHDILIRQEVHYEWIPLKCNHCQMFGHDEEHCKKKTVIKQVWRPVQKTAIEAPILQQQKHTTPPTTPRLDTQAKHVENMESAEYAPVIKHKAAHLSQSKNPTTQSDSINPFQALQGLNEEEHVEIHSDQELKDFNPCSTSQART